MSAERVARLFHAGVSGAGGTGYGTVSLVECLTGLGAACRVETAPGAGTRVTVRLSGAPAEDRPAVLLLDPNPRRRRARAVRLSSAGYGAWQAGSPAEALAMARGTPLCALLIARGATGAGLANLAAHCARERRSIEDDPAQPLLERIIDFFEDQPGRRKGVGQFAAHANFLASLTREYKRAGHAQLLQLAPSVTYVPPNRQSANWAAIWAAIRASYRAKGTLASRRRASGRHCWSGRYKNAAETACAAELVVVYTRPERTA